MTRVSPRDTVLYSMLFIIISVWLALRYEVQRIQTSILAVAIVRSQLSNEVRRQRVHDLVSGNGSALELRTLLNEIPHTGQRKSLADSLVHDGSNAPRSMLFLACMHRSPALVEVLLWADANATLGRPDEGTTPLHLAAGWLHHAGIVELLLASRSRDEVITSIKAKPSAGGLRGHTPAVWSRWYKHDATYQRLLIWMRDVGGWRYDEANDEYERDEQPQLWASLAAADW